MTASPDTVDQLFDPSGYYGRGAILQLAPTLGYERMLEKVEKLAPKFWGLASENSLIPPVPDVQNRIIQLKNILKVAPFTQKFGDIASWAFNTPAAEIKSSGEHTGNRKVKRPSVSSKRRSGAQAPVEERMTYLDAYRQNNVAAFVLKNLQAEGDPLAESVIALTSWRLSSESHQPTHLFEKLGHRAFELAVFSARGEAVIQLIQDYVPEQTPNEEV